MVFDTERIEPILVACIESENEHQFKYILEELRLNPNKGLKCFDGLSTFEKVLTKPNSRKFIEICVSNGCDFFKKNPDGTYPLQHAIQSNCADNLIAILKPNEESFTPLCVDHFVATKYLAIVNETSKGGNNYLHLLSNNITDNNYGELSKMIMDMVVNGCNVNLPNEHQETPFYLLLKNRLVDKNLINFIIDNGRVDCYTHNSKDIQQLMEERGLTASMGQKVDFPVDTNYVLQHLGEWNEAQLIHNLECWKEGQEENDDGIMELLEAAIVQNLLKAVVILMELGPGINGISQKSKFKMTPGFLACTLGHYQVLKVLLNNKNLSFQSTNPQRNLLHQVFASKVVDPDDRQRTFDLIIADRRCGLDLINQPDADNRVVLLLACQYECDAIVKELLRRGAYIGYESVLDCMKRDTLEQFLNECVKCSSDIREKNCEIYIDYKFLTPPDRKKQEITPANLICANPNLKEFVLHPVIASFVLLKWRKIDFIVYFNILIYFGFLVYLVYITVKFYYVADALEHDVAHCDMLNQRRGKWFNNTFGDFSFSSGMENTSITAFLFKNENSIKEMFEKNPETNNWKEKFDKWTEVQHSIKLNSRFRQYISNNSLFYGFGFFGIMLMVAYEVIQCVMSGKKYFLKVDNWLDISLICLALYVFAENITGMSFSFLVLSSQTPLSWKEICAGMILLIGAQSIQLFSRVSAVSLSLHMAILKKVCQTFLKTIAPYLVIILAFGMSFFALNHGEKSVNFYTTCTEANTCNEKERENKKSDGFSSPFLTTISTVRMMLADFGAVTINNNDFFQGFLFIAFMVSVSVILLNLLNALAISDTNKILEIAEFVETKKRVETLCGYDNLFSFFRVTYANVFPELTTIMLTPNKGSTVSVKQRAETLDNCIILMQKIGDTPNFKELNVNWMFWKKPPQPVRLSKAVINKILNFVKNQQEKDCQHTDKILQELIKMTGQDTDKILQKLNAIDQELMKITNQYGPSNILTEYGSRLSFPT